MDTIIEIDHLSKSFGDIRAVQDLSFQVREGELFAFLGVNGAGKSTTSNILCGQLAKDGGSVRICGADPDRRPTGSSAAWEWCFRIPFWTRACRCETIWRAARPFTALPERPFPGGWRS